MPQLKDKTKVLISSIKKPAVSSVAGLIRGQAAGDRQVSVCDVAAFHAML